MLNRYLARVALTSLVLFSALAAGSPPPTALPLCSPALRDRYSPRALRRLHALLLLRILEARRERLALAQSAIAQQVPIDRILSAPDDAAVLLQESGDSHLKHFRLDAASKCW
jgi:hypothetical protein